MQPFFGPSSSHPGIFEAILEACSHGEIPMDEEEAPQHQEQPRRHEITSDQIEQNRGNAWFFMDQTPFESILEPNDASKEEIKLEFKRVKSLREEQESKIASFLRQDKYKSLRDIEIPMKNESPNGKSAQSLSPRKTKKIDKSRPLKLVLQFD